MSSHLYSQHMSSSAVDSLAASEGSAPFMPGSSVAAAAAAAAAAVSSGNVYGGGGVGDGSGHLQHGGGGGGALSQQHQLRPLSLRLGSVGGVTITGGSGAGGAVGSAGAGGGLMSSSPPMAGGGGALSAQQQLRQQQLVQRLLQQTGGSLSPAAMAALVPPGGGGSGVSGVRNVCNPQTVGSPLGAEIRDVWAHNLHQEMEAVRRLVQKYPYVSMDTEFPGVVARPVGSFNSKTDYHFQTVRCNVDLLKIIQIGLTFCDEQGNLPPGCSCWQFNFQFSLSDDMYSQDSIDLLQKSGIDFARFDRDGIDPADFGELVMSSGLVLNPSVKWVSFHSGYDFGYFLKLLTCTPLPAEEDGFFTLLRTYFPCVYDIKHLMQTCRPLHGGLQDVADDLDVKRYGPQHQAGSDSLLTAGTFFRLIEVFFENEFPDKFNCFLFGLSAAAAAASAPSRPRPETS